MTEGTRLNKFLAACGVGSRRTCDALVQEGHVEINGQPCLNPAERVQPGDFVRVDGKRVEAKRVDTIVIHKPRNFVCSKQDELGRETVYNLIPGSLRHLNHVGRLDLDSEGMLVLTNDGNLSQSLLHPSKQIEKEYLVTSSRPVLEEHLDQFRRGIFVDDEETGRKVRLAAKEVERLSQRRLRLVLVTGYKRQIRVMFQTLGYHVERLIRVRIGSLELGALGLGKIATLTPQEIELLLKNPPPAKIRPAPARKKPKASGPPPPAKSKRPVARKAAKKAAFKRPAPPARKRPRR